MLIGLINDYMNEDDRYKDLTDEKKGLILQDSTRRLSIQIRDERRKKRN